MSKAPTQEQLDEWKEAFSLYDKKGNSTVSSSNLGDLLRGLGQNPTQAEVRELIKETAKSKNIPENQEFDIDFGIESYSECYHLDESLEKRVGLWIHQMEDRH
ncbi:Putative Genomic scaffold, msy_sf_5 [Rhizopus microsporus]|nr:Putative Genomic scaffold, msy_sf_5 [Rhizopus microsporus]